MNSSYAATMFSCPTCSSCKAELAAAEVKLEAMQAAVDKVNFRRVTVMELSGLREQLEKIEADTIELCALTVEQTVSDYSNAFQGEDHEIHRLEFKLHGTVFAACIRKLIKKDMEDQL